jgi:hypothetical protein
MIAQRMRHRVENTDELVTQMFDEELDRILRELPPDAEPSLIETYKTARHISEALIRNEEFDPI